ncbi:MAG TPA: dipeptide epimerase [Flavitalea sp.]|nr:dipeptide epimerase [Flavitalea sp.]
MKLRYWSYELPFKYPFTISYGTKTHQPTLVVELEHMGIKGYGEAPAITYYHIPVEKMIADLEQKRTFIEKYALTNPDRFWHFLHHLIPDNSFLVCALDIAAWDLYGKLRRQSLMKLWNYDPASMPLTDYTIGMDSIDLMLKKIDENPWPVYKIKLGSPDDIQIAEAIRSHTGARLRVDANAAWNLDQALQMIPILGKLGVELIEQPLAKDNWEGMKALYTASEIPLFADEACVGEQDVERCAGLFHGINIKLTKCGGITPARRMIARAKSLGLQVMIGSMNESSVGTAAVAHLLPSVDFADADGPLLLAEDLAEGLSFDHGRLSVSGNPGLGIHFKGQTDRS